MTTSTIDSCTAVPSRPATAEPLIPVASLIDTHRRLARCFLRASGYHRWNRVQTWHYMARFRSYNADVVNALDEAAENRRILAVLLAYRRAGVEYLRQARWDGVKAAAINAPTPKRPLMAVNTGHGVVVDQERDRASYPLAVGDRYVGEVWRNRHGWWAVRMGPNGGVIGMVASGPHRISDAAAYAVGFLIADH